MANFNQFVSEIVNQRGFVNVVKQQNIKHTENGAVARESTNYKLYDLFALGGAYRSRTESDCILLFKQAYDENPKYALKCLWYLRDILDGQGERRFFRVCLRWLATYHTATVLRNMETIARDGFGRFDDLFVLFDTPCEEAMLQLIKTQLADDLESFQRGENQAISLCAKWLPSINASSATTKQYGRRMAAYLGLSQKTYRKMLSMLRERIHVVERLMSQNRWDEIDFSHLPSRAGLIYRNAFARREMIAQKYKEFAQDENTTVNASALYPYDVVREAKKLMLGNSLWYYNQREPSFNDPTRLMVNKYWNNLKDYFSKGRSDLMVVCDTSGSMLSGASNTAAPIEVAVSLAMYAAERAQGPFFNHYISFSRNARLVDVEGIDFCDKVARIIRSNLCENTNLESVFDLVVDTAVRANLRPSEVPKTLVIISDMEVDAVRAGESNRNEIFMARMRRNWDAKCGGKYKFPSLVCWNVSARNDTFLDDPFNDITFVSGCSPVLFTQILQGVSGMELMFQTLDAERYEKIG